MKKFFLLGVMAIMTTSFCVAMETEPVHKSSIAWATDDGIPLTVELKTIEENIFISAKLDAVSYCLVNGNELIFTLETGESVKLKNMNGVDCGKSSMYVCFISPEDIGKLKQSPVAKVKMFTEDGSFELTNIKDKDFFINSLSNISKPKAVPKQ